LSAEHAVLFDDLPPIYDDSSSEHTNLLFKGLNYPIRMMHLPETMTEHLLEKIGGFEGVVPKEELEEVRNKLSRGDY
jgi:hypothetical protein